MYGIPPPNVISQYHVDHNVHERCMRRKWGSGVAHAPSGLPPAVILTAVAAATCREVVLFFLHRPILFRGALPGGCELLPRSYDLVAYLVRYCCSFTLFGSVLPFACRCYENDVGGRAFSFVLFDGIAAAVEASFSFSRTL